MEYDEERGEWYSKFDTGELGEEDIPEMGERRKAPAKKKVVVKKVKDKAQKAEPAAVRKSVRQRKTPKQFEN